jgi:hypothetical protein
MKVIATKPGYFGKLRAAGDVFEVPDGTKPASWFEPVEPPAPDGKKAKPEKSAV